MENDDTIDDTIGDTLDEWIQRDRGALATELRQLHISSGASPSSASTAGSSDLTPANIDNLLVRHQLDSPIDSSAATVRPPSHTSLSDKSTIRPDHSPQAPKNYGPLMRAMAFTRARLNAHRQNNNDNNNNQPSASTASMATGTGEPTALRHGDRIRLQDGRTGTVVFVGYTELSNDTEQVGIRLDDFRMPNRDFPGAYTTVSKGKIWMSLNEVIATATLLTPGPEVAGQPGASTASMASLRGQTGH